METIHPDFLKKIIEHTPHDDLRAIYKLFSFASTPDLIEKLIDKGFTLNTHNMVKYLSTDMLNETTLDYLMKKGFSKEINKHYLLFLKDVISDNTLSGIIDKYHPDPINSIIENAIIDNKMSMDDVFYIIDKTNKPVIDVVNQIQESGFSLLIQREKDRSITSRSHNFLSNINANYSQHEALIQHMFGPQINFLFYKMNIINIDTFIERYQSQSMNLSQSRSIDSHMSNYNITYEDILNQKVKAENAEFFIENMIQYLDVLPYNQYGYEHEKVLSLFKSIPPDWINIQDKNNESVLGILKNVKNFDQFNEILDILSEKGFNIYSKNNNNNLHVKNFVDDIYHALAAKETEKFNLHLLNYFYKNKYFESPELIELMDQIMLYSRLNSDENNPIFRKCAIDSEKEVLNNSFLQEFDKNKKNRM